MDRRGFVGCLAGMGAAALGAPTRPAAAQSQEQRNDDDGTSNMRPNFGRISLRLQHQVLIPVRLLILQRNSTRALGVELNRTFPMFNEDRAGLLTPTLGQRFRNSQPVGEVRASGGTLLIVTDDALNTGIVNILNRDTSYRVNAERLGRVVEVDVPALGNLPVLGSLFRQSSTRSGRSELLIMVTPTILDDRI